VERIYEYDKAAYYLKVILSNIVAVVLFGYCLYRFIANQSNVLLWLSVMLVCVYVAGSSFIRKSNARYIRISDETISFVSFGEKSFKIAELTMFQVRSTNRNYQVLVRIEDSNGRHGIFWVPYHFFCDKRDLLAEFDFLERKVHPDSFRFRGKNTAGILRPHETAEAGSVSVGSEGQVGGNS
jgi:hypothetical protein